MVGTVFAATVVAGTASGNGGAHMLPVACVYLGFAVAVVGFLALLRPMPWLGLVSPGRGAALLLAGLLLIFGGGALPAPEQRVAIPRTLLDQFAPAYQFNEVHSIRVNAPASRVYRALTEVTAGEIRFFRALTSIRRFGRPGPESILNAPERRPILEVATRTSFLVLAQEANRELVLGTVVVAPPGSDDWRPTTPEAFAALIRPGFAKAVINFQIEPRDQHTSHLSTETRVFATDATTRRRFAAYWRVIYPGSALIRREWLRAIRRRAEGDGSPTS